MSLRRLFVGACLLCAAAGCSPARDPAFIVRARLVDVDGRSGSAAASTPGAPVYQVLRRDNVYHHTATMAAGESGASDLNWPVPRVADARLRFGYTLERQDGSRPSGTVRVQVSLERPSGTAAIVFTAEEQAEQLADTIRSHRVGLPALPSGSVLRFSMRATAPGGWRMHWVDPVLLLRQEARPNVLIVMVDTLRVDRLTAFGGPAVVMPFVDRRLGSAAIFERAYANANWTLPSVASLLTGLFPGRHNAGRRIAMGAATRAVEYHAEPVAAGMQMNVGGQAFRFQMLHPSVPTLGTRLADARYYTAAIHDNGYLNHPIGVLRGMEYAREVATQEPAGTSDAAIAWLREHHDEQFFLFLHYLGPHQWPLGFAPALLGAPPETVGEPDRRRVLAAYDALARQTDDHLARMFQEFDALGLAAHTYVVFVSDHGERFFSGGAVGEHGGGISEQTLHVPLAIWGPDITARRVPSRVSLVDVAPTILDLLGLPVESSLFSGDTLSPALEGRRVPDREFISEFALWQPPAAEETALFAGDWKYVHVPGTPGADRLQRAGDDGADLSAGQPEAAQRLRDQIERYLAGTQRDFLGLSYADRPVDDETLRSLRALGYIR